MSTDENAKKTILLVEDNLDLRPLFVEILESNGYNVLEASDGGTALVLMEQNKDVIDLVITDMVMPKIGGRELYRRATQLDPHVKFIYISGYFEDNKSQDSFYNLQKPFSEEALIEKVRQVLES